MAQLERAIEDAELWQRVTHYPFDGADAAFNLVEKLAQTEGWPEGYAKSVVKEYRRFIYLACTCEHYLVPPNPVDRAWRLHSLRPTSYVEDFCKKSLGMELSRENLHANREFDIQSGFDYCRTLYSQKFGVTPPEGIWETPAKTFSQHNLVTGPVGKSDVEAELMRDAEMTVPADKADVEAELVHDAEELGNLSDPALWARISAHSLDAKTGSAPLSVKLARQQGWTADYTAIVLTEYRRFVYLSQVSEEQVTPSEVIDRAWHMHLTYTREYWEDFVPNVLGQPLHHEPSIGDEEMPRYPDQFAKCRALYEKAFGQPPPDSVWKRQPNWWLIRVAIALGSISLIAMAPLSQRVDDSPNAPLLFLASLVFMIICWTYVIWMSPKKRYASSARAICGGGGGCSGGGCGGGG